MFASFIDIQGDIEKGYFYVPVKVGKNEDGSLPFEFPMLLVFLSFSPIILCRILHLLLP